MHVTPGIARRLDPVSVARSFNAARNDVWCALLPVSAAVTAYCIGTVLHNRPSASLRIAAATSSSRGERPIDNQPVRHPGARYAFDRLENEITGASGSRLPSGGTVPSYPRSAYNSAARTHS